MKVAASFVLNNIYSRFEVLTSYLASQSVPGSSFGVSDPCWPGVLSNIICGLIVNQAGCVSKVVHRQSHSIANFVKFVSL